MKLKNYHFLFIDIPRVYRNESIEPLDSPIHGQLSTTYRTAVPFYVRMFKDLAIVLLYYWSSTSRPNNVNHINRTVVKCYHIRFFFFTLSSGAGFAAAMARANCRKALQKKKSASVIAWVGWLSPMWRVNSDPNLVNSLRYVICENSHAINTLT